VVANSALALKVAGISNDLNECIGIAEESILSGRTLQKLSELKEFGNKNK
jgi:anthranilate phosphoribosyltransferase